jgi:hypothetical protein
VEEDQQRDKREREGCIPQGLTFVGCRRALMERDIKEHRLWAARRGDNGIGPFGVADGL